MLFEFRFPDIGEGVHEGIVLEWKRSVGDRVRQGDILALVETDKVAAEIPSPVDGTLVSLGAGAGQTVEVGQVLARLEVEEADSGRAADGEAEPEPAPEDSGPAAIVGRLEPGGEALLPPSAEGRTPASATPASATPASATPAAGVKASPLARRLAARQGIDIRGLAGTGPSGRVLKEDVLRASTPPGAEAGGGTLTPLSPLRRTIARNMEESWRIPAALVQESTVVDELLRARERLNAEAERAGEGAPGPARYSFLPFFLKAAALALREFPLLNSLYYPDQESYLSSAEINLGLALDTPRGLLVPVIRSADRLSLAELQQSVDRLRRGAAEESLTLFDLRGGTFTITNYGSVGGSYGRPLIFPPQTGILGIGRIAEAALSREGRLVSASVLPLSLVFDHRLIDGAYAARFLGRFMALVSEPYTLLAALR